MTDKRQKKAFRPRASGYILFEPEDRIKGPAVARGPQGVNIRAKSNLQHPRAVYLVHLNFDNNGQLVVRQLADNFSAGETIKKAEERLFDRIENHNQYDDVNFENMTWKNPTYFTFVITNPRWDFYWRNQDERHGPLRFFRRKDKIPRNTKIYRKNFAFYDAVKFKLLGVHNAFRCVNFVRDENGPLTNKNVADYCFQIYLEAPFAMNGIESNIIMLVDPDGQNQGPRV